MGLNFTCGEEFQSAVTNDGRFMIFASPLGKKIAFFDLKGVMKKIYKVIACSAADQSINKLSISPTGRFALLLANRRSYEQYSYEKYNTNDFFGGHTAYAKGFSLQAEICSALLGGFCRNSNSSDRLILLDLKTEKEVVIKQNEAINYFGFSKDGTRIFIWAADTFSIYNTIAMAPEASFANICA
jgi:hypothetical protein